MVSCRVVSVGSSFALSLVLAFVISFVIRLLAFNIVAAVVVFVDVARVYESLCEYLIACVRFRTDYSLFFFFFLDSFSFRVCIYNNNSTVRSLYCDFSKNERDNDVGEWLYYKLLPLIHTTINFSSFVAVVYSKVNTQVRDDHVVVSLQPYTLNIIIKICI